MKASMLPCKSRDLYPDAFNARFASAVSCLGRYSQCAKH